VVRSGLLSLHIGSLRISIAVVEFKYHFEELSLKGEIIAIARMDVHSFLQAEEQRLC
jgi:hypothetical protein